MDKNALKKYAIWARRELITRVSQRATFYGVTEADYGDVSADSINGRILSVTEKKQRQALISQIRKKGYEEVIEEVAYTWFNRFLALRFMEVNGYLPDRVKIFTDSENRFQPQILSEAIDLDIAGLDMEKVYAYKDANQTEELYKYLLVVQCNALNAVLPGMFQKIEDYTELLLPDKLLLEGSVIERMIALIPEEDWRDAVQIIGWMYQYYNSEKKDEVFAALKKNVKITKENIPAATQLFTPDWIVRYMVENSLGRLWLEGHPNGELKAKKLQEAWIYYLEEAQQEPEVEAELARIRAEYAQLTPEDIRCIDPCQGSGHILVYMFDVLMQIYESYGYTTQEAVAGIVKNSIYGLDIDERAAQLSYFAVMMKACQYDKRFLKRKDEEGKPKVPQPRVYAIQESNDVDSFVMEYFCNGNAELKEAMETIMEEMYDAKEYGSIITVTEQNWDVIYGRFEEIREDISIHKEGALELLPLVQVAQALAQKYDVVVTNPPYMGISGGNTKLSEFVKKNYPDSKTDLFAVFIESCKEMLRQYGYQAMITQHAWMFLASFEKLRGRLIKNQTIINMAHLGARAFEEIGGEVVQTTSFVVQKNCIAEYNGVYCRLIEPTTQKGKEEMYIAKRKRYIARQNNFLEIPGKPIAYWVSETVLKIFGKVKLSNVGKIAQGLITGDTDRFTRLWFEVESKRFIRNALNVEMFCYQKGKWVPYNKGGEYRKWYGNNDFVVNWENDGYEIKSFVNENGKLKSRPQGSDLYFKDIITWTKISSIRVAFRHKPVGHISSEAGMAIWVEESNKNYILAFGNSKVANFILNILSPTLNFELGDIGKLPVFMVDKSTHLVIDELVEILEEKSKADWDSFETSWDFKGHPIVQAYFDITRYQENGLLQGRNPHLLKDCYIQWGTDCNLRFETLKRNEEELNRIFIEIYGLQDELTPEVEDKDITVRKADLQRDIKSLISYAVGCMFGRYSLDKEGLIYAGGRMEDKFSYYGGTVADTQDYPLDGKYTWGELGSKFYYIPIEGKKALECWKVDADNIIPVTDDEYFEDDIVGKFISFIRMVYGENTLEENLKFIADALGGKGQPREVIRNYFLNDFYKDHCRIYQKRPIYWLFDSGKKNGFKCLIYMHRYESDTIARIRTDYVHEQQSRYRTAIADLENRIGNAGASERVKLNKSLKKIQEQADELHAYEEKIHHLADQMIAIDLDDGVKRNYEIFKDVLAKIK